MEANNFILRARQGKYSMLDKEYYRHINTILETIDEEQEIRWETYNLIIEELINLNHWDYFEEIKYRITDGENPNEVILEIIERDVNEVSGLIWALKKRLEEYIDEDFFKRFMI